MAILNRFRLFTPTRATKRKPFSVELRFSLENESGVWMGGSSGSGDACRIVLR